MQIAIISWNFTTKKNFQMKERSLQFVSILFSPGFDLAVREDFVL